MTELSGLAKRAYDLVMSQPTDEAAALAATMIVHAGLQYDLENHHDLIQKHLNTVVAKRLGKIKKGLVSTAISKRLDGEEIDHVKAAAEVISKIGFEDFTTEQRRQYASRQQRGPSGRFREMHRQIHYAEKPAKMPGKYAHGLGIPNSTLTGHDKARYQTAYLQVSELLNQFQDLPSGEGFLELRYSQKDQRRGETPRTMYVPLGPNGAQHIEADRFQNGQRLLSARVVTDNTLSAEGAAFDMVGALGGSPMVAGRAAAGLKQDSSGRFNSMQNLSDFERDWNEELNGNNPSDRIFTRLSAGSRLINQAGGGLLGPKAQVALRTADYVGQHAPEAQKVIGPTVDRTAYRYRGVEKPPDARTIAQISAIQRVKGADARDALIHGWDEPQARKPGQAPRMQHRESPLIRYFEGKLPTPELMELQRQSGVIPPSQGMIIDKSGKVITEAVGYGDDWYLPFNLKNLGKLRGGEYVRTRAWGGPTTEDIYAGLMSGAKAVTVVSHNGTYTIEFDPSFKGTRRYNDKAARMVKRYGHLLDAVQSKQVTLNRIPESREEELKTEAAGEFDPRYEKTKYTDRLKELKTNEHESPKMSAADKRLVAENFLARKAENQDLDSWEALGSQHVERQIGHARLQHKMYAEQLGVNMPFDEATARGTAAVAVSTPEKLIAASGWGDDYAKFLANAEADYKNAHSPLTLDGIGYKRSMDALQEQFPYYIKSAKWQEKRRGGYDYGYIKPRYNRPAGAAAGYFDRSITGVGKLPADAMRHQNRPYGQNLSLRRAEEKDKKTEGSAAASTGSGSNLSSAMREQADVMALHKEARQPTITFNGQQVDALNSPTAASQLKTLMPYVYGKTADEIAAEYARDPAAVKAGILKDVAHAKEKGYFSINSDLVDKVKDPTKAARGHTWSPLEAVNNPNRDYDFGHNYGPGRTVEQYEAAAQDLASRMGDRGEASDDELRAWIKDEAEVVRGRGQQGSRWKNEPSEPHVRNIENAVRMLQLRRRRQAAMQQAVNEQHANRPDVEIHQVDAGSLDDATRRTLQQYREQGYRAPGDDPRPPIAGN